MRGIAAIVLGLKTAIFPLDYLHTLTIKADTSYYIAAQNYSAPNPNPTSWQMVAHSIYDLTLEARIGDIRIPMGFYVQVYSSKPKNDEPAILSDASDLYQFLQNNEYGKILFFRMLKSGIHNEKLSVMIDKNEKKVFYDLEDKDNLVNHNLRFEESFDQVQPKLIEGIVICIMGWERIINLKRKGIIIPQVLEVTGIES